MGPKWASLDWQTKPGHRFPKTLPQRMQRCWHLAGDQHGQSVGPEFGLIQPQLERLDGHVNMGSKVRNLVGRHLANVMQRDMPVGRQVPHTTGRPSPVLRMDTQLLSDSIVWPQRQKKSLAGVDLGCR